VAFGLVNDQVFFQSFFQLLLTCLNNLPAKIIREMVKPGYPELDKKIVTKVNEKKSALHQTNGMFYNQIGKNEPFGKNLKLFWVKTT